MKNEIIRSIEFGLYALAHSKECQQQADIVCTYLYKADDEKQKVQVVRKTCGECGAKRDFEVAMGSFGRSNGWH